MRRSLAVPLALAAALAAAPLLAKPAAGGALDPERDSYREQGLSLCVAELQAAEGAAAADVEAICGCAFDRFMPRWPTGALPALGGNRLASAAGGDLLACAAEQRPALAGAVARRLAALPPAPEEGGKPAESASDAPAAGRGLRAWLDGLALPRWLTDSGLPLWAWVPLVLLVLMFLRGLLRRPERDDLMGPPRTMQLGGPGLRRPDPPQRS